MSKLKLSDVKISKKFAKTRPAQEKLDACQIFYLRNKKLDRLIVLDENNYLVDGYVAYLIAQQFGLNQVDVMWQQKAAV